MRLTGSFMILQLFWSCKFWDSEIMRYSRNRVNPTKKISRSPHVGQKLRLAPHSWNTLVFSLHIVKIHEKANKLHCGVCWEFSMYSTTACQWKLCLCGFSVHLFSTFLMSARVLKPRLGLKILQFKFVQRFLCFTWTPPTESALLRMSLGLSLPWFFLFYHVIISHTWHG